MLLSQQTAILDEMIIYRSNPAQALLLRERAALEPRSNLSLLDLMKCVVTTVPQRWVSSTPFGVPFRLPVQF